MRLHSPQFERGLRRAVKRTVRRSPALRREAKRGRVRRQVSGGPFLRVLFSGALGIAVWHAHQATGHAGTALAVMTLWLGALSLFRAAHLLTCLFQPTDGPAMSCLPISDADVFRWQQQKFIRGSVFALVDIAVGFAVLNFACGLGWIAWLALPLLTLATGVSLAAFAALLATRAPKVVLMGRGLLFVGGFVVFVALRILGDNSGLAGRAWRLFDAQAEWFNLLLPTGWAVSLHRLLDPQVHWSALIWLPLTGILIWSLRHSFGRLERHYGFQEVQTPEAPDLMVGVEAEGTPPLRSDGGVPRVGVTTIEEIVEHRRFLEAPSWFERGWMERWLWNRLTGRERILSEFAFVHGLSLSAAWKKIFRNLLIGLAGGFALSFVSPVIGAWFAGLGVFVSGCQVLAQVLATGTAFQKVQCSGVQIPIHAVYAIGFRELSRLLFKTTAVQVPLLLLFAVIVALAGSRALGSAHFPVLLAFMMGLKAGGLLVAARFLLVAMAFSSGTNDTTRIRLRTFGLVVGSVFMGLLFLLLGGASLFAPDAGAAWLLFALAALDAYAFFRLYGWFYNTNRFDLMCLPRR